MVDQMVGEWSNIMVIGYWHLSQQYQKEAHILSEQQGTVKQRNIVR